MREDPWFKDAREVIAGYDRRIRRPRRPGNVQKRCGVRFFTTRIQQLTSLGFSPRVFALGLIVPDDVMAEVAKMGAAADANHFPRAFGFIGCQLEKQQGEITLVIMEVQSQPYSKLEAVKKREGENQIGRRAQRIRDEHTDYAKVMVLGAHELAGLLGARRVFYLDKFSQEKRIYHIWGMHLPESVGDRLYTRLPLDMGYRPWLGAGYPEGENLTFHVDGIDVNSGYMLKLHRERTPAGAAFKRLQIKDSTSI